MLPGQTKNTSESPRGPVAIGSVLKSVEYYLRANRQSLLAVQDSLATILPVELLDQTQPVSVRGGLLTLAVADAAAKCLLEMILRGQAFEVLRNALPQMSLRKVKVVLK